MRIKFHLGQNKDHSPGDGISESFEELSEEARGGARYVGVLQQRVGSCEYQKITVN